MREQYRPEPTRSRKPLYGAFTAIGIVGGLLARDAIETTGRPITATQPQAYEAPAPIYPTIVVHSVIEFPTPTPTPEPTVVPTRIATKVADDFCSTPEPGTVCRIPPPPPPTPTPYPNCEISIATPENSNDLCAWPTEVAVPTSAPLPSPIT